jgi:hypothetical protein
LRAPATLRAGALVLGAVLLVGGCTGGDAAPNVDEPSTEESASPTSTPEPTVDPAAYKRSLALTVRPVNQALVGVANARGLPALAASIGKAQTALGKAAQDLESLEPPDAAAAEHSRLAQALSDLSADLGGVTDGVEGKELCAHSSVLGQLGKARGMTSIPAATKALTAKGFTVNVVIPKTPPVQNRRLPTGHYLRRGSTSGNGSLTIDNGTDSDTVITLAKGKQPTSVVYVRAHGRFEIKKVRDATYTVYYATGQDWDSASRSFTRQCGFKKFDKEAKFTTTRRGNYIYYSRFSLTLQPVVGGNATTSDVDPKDFPVQ